MLRGREGEEIGASSFPAVVDAIRGGLALKDQYKINQREVVPPPPPCSALSLTLLSSPSSPSSDECFLSGPLPQVFPRHRLSRTVPPSDRHRRTDSPCISPLDLVRGQDSRSVGWTLHPMPTFRCLQQRSSRVAFWECRGKKERVVLKLEEVLRQDGRGRGGGGERGVRIWRFREF